MNKKEEFEKLVQEFIDSRNELNMFLDDMVDNVNYDSVNGTIDVKSFKAGVINTVLECINMEIFEYYSSSLAEDLDNE